MRKSCAYRWLRVFLAASVLVFFGGVCAFSSGNGEGNDDDDDQDEGVVLMFEERITLGVHVTAPKAFLGRPLIAQLIPIIKEVPLHSPLNEFRFLYIFNLDIYGENNGEKIAIGTEIDEGLFVPEPRIQVFLTIPGLSEPGELEKRLFYYIPEERWFPIYRLIEEKKISPIFRGEDNDEYFFEIHEWPADDRLIIYGG